MNITYPAATTASTTPNFVSMVRAELFKLSRQRGVWITAIVVAVVFILASLVFIFEIKAAVDFSGANAGGQFHLTPPAYGLMSQILNSNTGVRGMIGIFVAVATVFSVAQEYQQGTIRIMLARGVGRLRLLGAKLTAVGLVSLAMLAVLLVLALVMSTLDIQWALGPNAGLVTIPDYLWSDTFGYVVAILVSMLATLLLAAMFAVIGRNMAFGMSFALAYFFAEGVVSLILQGVALATNNSTWSNIPHYFIGAAITNVPAAVLPNRGLNVFDAATRGISALLQKPAAGQVVGTLIAYIVVFAALSGYLTVKRDVLQ